MQNKQLEDAKETADNKPVPCIRTGEVEVPTPHNEAAPLDVLTAGSQPAKKL